MFWLGLIIGFIAGTIAGVFTAALVIAGKDGENDKEI